MTLRDQRLICDQCQKEITRITTTPGEGWAASMHNLCSACFQELHARSLSRA